MPSGDTPSALLLDEYFASQDPRFVATLRQISGFRRLAAFADRWKVDPRPWARQQIFAYLATPLNCPTHQPLVKHLFKHAEEQNDSELMAAFMHVFDCLVRLGRRTRHRYDWESRQTWTEETLFAPRNTVPLTETRPAINPRTLEPFDAVMRVPQNARLFSYKTRYYLRRRAWRFFRKIGYLRPAEYVASVAAALKRYTDNDLAAGEHILESWGLMHACFHHHDAIEWTAGRCRLKEGRSVGELTPAPRFPKLWQDATATTVLLSLVGEAGSRLVRVWAQALLRRDHAAWLKTLPAEQLVNLRDHESPEVQQFAAELIDGLEGLAKLPVRTWLRLLQTKNPAALAMVCEAMTRHVTAERLELAEMISLANAEAAPVARMGLAFLKQSRIESAVDREAIVALADARCAVTGRELAQWALQILGGKATYELDQVIRFFDSLLAEVREGAWAWLTGEGQPAAAESTGFRDARLWSRLIETPFDDVRFKLVELLEQRAHQASLAGRTDEPTLLPHTSAAKADLTPVWSTVLLGVHRGGRAKIKALRQISDALAANPQRADILLPVLAVAIRSVRPAEVRPGLAAIVGAVEAQPSLATLVSKYLPELGLTLVGGAR